MRTPFLPLLAIALLAACQSDPKSSPEYQQLSEDAGRSASQVAQRDSTINMLFGTMNRISENLRTIRAKQGQLLGPDHGAEGPDVEQRVMEDPAGIDALLNENKELIGKLRKQAKASAGTLAELEKTVALLESSLAEKDAEIGPGRSSSRAPTARWQPLIEMYRDKSQVSDMQRYEMNTRWYAIGTQKELRANGVLAKEGGIAGIGAVNKLNAENLPKDYFTQIDMTRTLEIPLAAKKAKLATAHPAGSYRLEEGAEKLVITDPNAFWSLSKYLVVVVE
ncbi:MAG: hypothetical protein IPM46_10165 [Flavobacteriales bacterium]|nr:hypothetical protein [Flavobacteriales bacterium]